MAKPPISSSKSQPPLSLLPPKNREVAGAQALVSCLTQHTQKMPVQWSPAGHPGPGRPRTLAPILAGGQLTRTDEDWLLGFRDSELIGELSHCGRDAIGNAR